MKKLYFAIIILFQTAYVIGQCPTVIDDDGGDGTVYYMTLANGAAECVNYAGDITINNVTYEFSFCDAGSNEVEFTIAAGGTAVIIANDAPITIVNGATTCGYDASGNLPVELVFFKGEITERGTHLTWQTATEENNKGFEIQRSTDGENWEVVDFVTGAGTTLITQNYEYTDAQPFQGTNYYRLKQIDYDGQFEYSDIVTVELGIANNKLSIYPNPVRDELNIIDGEGQATIYNTLGQAVRQFAVGSEQFAVNTTSLPSGQYILYISKENGTVITKRFIRSSLIR